MSNYKPQDFAEMLGVSVKHFKDRTEKVNLKHLELPSNRRYYTDEHLTIFNEGRREICSKDLKQKLE